MQLLQVTPSPAPAVPHLAPIAPPFDLTWLFEGIGSIVCILLAILFLILLIRRGSSGEGFSPALLVGTVVAAGFAIFLGIDGTNHLMPELRQYSVYGVIAVIVGGVWLFASTTD